MNLNYFEDAVDLVMSFKKVNASKGVGVVGISKGAEAVLSMGTFLPKEKIGAIAVMNSLLYHGVMPVVYNSKQVCEGKLIDIYLLFQV